ncbi:6-P2ase) (AtF2KP) (PFK/FBPase) [Includes: 6-phosphofructo-2-kinase [Durusdinium trenchii]|uniref:6-P2ase (AtF2KP (PFK/FBPase n=1 Tax=Durusdinium trenchii TaxID=1381693 RepID=A0ABP0ID39_9DINO
MRFLLNLHGQRRPIFFSRHGQSEYNQLGKIGGDSVLTAHGEEYATALAEWVDKEAQRRSVKLDSEGKPRPARLWTSSLKRTRLTARHIRRMACHRVVRQVRVQMRPKMHRNLDEIYAGLCDGMTYEECDLRSKAKQPTHAMLVRSDPIDPRDACEIRPNLIRDL